MKKLPAFFLALFLCILAFSSSLAGTSKPPPGDQNIIQTIDLEDSYSFSGANSFSVEEVSIFEQSKFTDSQAFPAVLTSNIFNIELSSEFLRHRYKHSRRDISYASYLGYFGQLKPPKLLLC